MKLLEDPEARAEAQSAAAQLQGLAHRPQIEHPTLAELLSQRRVPYLQIAQEAAAILRNNLSDRNPGNPTRFRSSRYDDGGSGKAFGVGVTLAKGF